MANLPCIQQAQKVSTLFSRSEPRRLHVAHRWRPHLPQVLRGAVAQLLFAQGLRTGVGDAESYCCRARSNSRECITHAVERLEIGGLDIVRCGAPQLLSVSKGFEKEERCGTSLTRPHHHVLVRPAREDPDARTPLPKVRRGGVDDKAMFEDAIAGLRDLPARIFLRSSGQRKPDRRNVRADYEFRRRPDGKAVSESLVLVHDAPALVVPVLADVERSIDLLGVAAEEFVDGAVRARPDQMSAAGVLDIGKVGDRLQGQAPGPAARPICEGR